MKSRGKTPIGVLANDIHLDRGNIELVKDIFRQAVDVCKRYEVNNIFCGGDVFTNRSGQPLSCLTAWKEILDMLKKEGIILYAIPGNHDKTDADDYKSYLEIYSKDSFHLFSHSDYFIFDNSVVGFIPFFSAEKWLEEYNSLLEILIKKKLFNGDYTTILITHIGFDGVRNNDGSAVVSDLKPSLLKKWDKVFVGHYHNASQLSENIFYTGSVYQGNFSENITDKGFTVIFDNGATEHISTTFPKYIKEVIDVEDKESLKNLIEKYGDTRDGSDHIRFVFRGKKADCQKINLNEIITKYGISCQFESTEEKAAMEMSESEAVLSYDRKSIVKSFVQFCSENNIKGQKLLFGLKFVKEM